MAVWGCSKYKYLGLQEISDKVFTCATIKSLDETKMYAQKGNLLSYVPNRRRKQWTHPSGNHLCVEIIRRQGRLNARWNTYFLLYVPSLAAKFVIADFTESRGDAGESKVKLSALEQESAAEFLEKYFIKSNLRKSDLQIIPQNLPPNPPVHENRRSPRTQHGAKEPKVKATKPKKKSNKKSQRKPKTKPSSSRTPKSQTKEVCEEEEESPPLDEEEEESKAHGVSEDDKENTSDNLPLKRLPAKRKLPSTSASVALLESMKNEAQMHARNPYKQKAWRLFQEIQRQRLESDALSLFLNL